MNNYTKIELEEALLIVSSTISRCEKLQPNFNEGTSQHTLLKNRIKALLYLLPGNLLFQDMDSN